MLCDDTINIILYLRVFFSVLMVLIVLRGLIYGQNIEERSLFDCMFCLVRGLQSKGEVAGVIFLLYISCCNSKKMVRCKFTEVIAIHRCFLSSNISVVTKAVDAETETKTEAAWFETEAKTETVASETEAKTEAVYLKTEAEAQGSWPI